MSLQRGIDGAEPVRPERVAGGSGPEEIRRVERTTQLATGTLACPACDAPVMPEGRMTPSAPLLCPYCGERGAVRDFLTLGSPARPARVAVHVVQRRR